MAEFLKCNADFEFSFSACAIGTQGPDIFFFHRLFNRFKAKSKVGSALHRAKPSDILDAFSDYCKFSPNIDIAKSYMYGFILHYALDRKCHPFVYSFQEKISAKNTKIHPSAIHNRIEMAMDSYLLGKRLGISVPSDFDSAKTLTSDIEITEEISHLLSFVIPRVSTYSISEKEVGEAIRDTRLMQKLLRDKSGLLKSFLRIAETLLAPMIGHFKFSSMIKPKDLEKAKKYGNINNRGWRPINSDKLCYDSFEDLFETAKTEAELMIMSFDKLCLGYLSGYEITNNISFLNGTEVI